MARPTTHRVARSYPRQWAVNTAPHVGTLEGKEGRKEGKRGEKNFSPIKMVTKKIVQNSKLVLGSVVLDPGYVSSYSEF